MSGNDEVSVNSIAIQETLGKDISPQERLQIIQKTVLKNFSPSEIALTVQRSQSIGANILAGEMWAYKDNKGNLINICSRQFLGKKAELNPEFDGLQSGAIYDKDEFSINTATGEISHIVKAFGKKERGELIGSYAVAWRKNGKPICFLAERKTYDKKQFIWASHTEAMMIKVAESVVLRKFALLGADILGEGEYTPVEKQKKPQKLDISKITQPCLTQ